MGRPASLAAAIQPDARTPWFGPDGLMPDRQLTAEGSFEFLRALVSKAIVHEGVPPEIRGHPNYSQGFPPPLGAPGAKVGISVVAP